MLQDVLRFSHPGAAYDTATSTRAMRMYRRTVLFKRDMRFRLSRKLLNKSCTTFRPVRRMSD
jgi:hypothetical protein